MEKQMIRRLAVLAAVLGLGLASLASAAGRQSVNVDLKDDTSLAGTKLPAGKYKITWTASGTEAEVSVAQGKKVVVTTKGKLVDRDRPASDDEVVSRKNAAGAFALSEVRLQGEKRVLVLGAS
jgi:hypothetical protein